MKITSEALLSTQVRKLGIDTWDQLKLYIQNLTYGRTSKRDDLTLILTEQKGTCSSKHALLKQVADENQIPDVKLIFCLFKMSPKNTSGIEDILASENLSYIPEGHCYLKINGNISDLTSPTFDIAKHQEDIIEERELDVDQIGQFKVAYHQDKMKAWLKDSQKEIEFETLWAVRERCIERLARLSLNA